MLPDARTARILGLEKQAFKPLFEKMIALAFHSRVRRLAILAECQQHMNQFRAAYAERRKRSSQTERMLQLLEQKITELAQAASEPQDASRCGVCGSSLTTTGIGTFCEPCLDTMLPFYELLEFENSSFSRTGRGL